jgi:hypothetical protein
MKTYAITYQLGDSSTTQIMNLRELNATKRVPGLKILTKHTLVDVGVTEEIIDAVLNNWEYVVQASDKQAPLDVSVTAKAYLTDKIKNILITR